MNLITLASLDSAELLSSLFPTLSPEDARAAAYQLSLANHRMPPSPNVANALRVAANAHFNSLRDTSITNHYAHNLFQEHYSRILFLTSWPLANNLNMSVEPSTTADPTLPVTYGYLLEGGELCTTAAVTLAMGDDLTENPDVNMIDMNPIAVGNGNNVPPSNNSGAYQPPSFHGQVLSSTSEALLRGNFDPDNTTPHAVIMAQSAPVTRALLAAASRIGASVHRTTADSLLATFGLSTGQIDGGGGGNFGVYLLEQGGRFILLVAVPSASLATAGPVSRNRNGVVLTTFNLMQVTRALTGQPLLDANSSAYIGGTNPSSSVRALADVVERCEGGASYSTPSQRGGRATVESHGPQMANGPRAGGLATVASHGPQMANGGRATVESHGPQMANGPRATVESHGPQMANRTRAGGRVGGHATVDCGVPKINDSKRRRRK